MEEPKPNIKRRIPFKYLWPIMIFAFVMEVILLVFHDVYFPKEKILYFILSLTLINTALIGFFSFLSWLIWFVPRINFRNKTANIRFLLIVSVFFILYFSMFFYGRLIIQPANEAIRLIDQAETLLIQEPLPQTLAEDISRQKEYIALYELASKIDSKNFEVLGYQNLDKYINDVILFMKEVLDWSEKANSRSIVYTKESADAKIAEFTSKRKSINENNFSMIPLWVTLIFLR